MKIRLDTKSKTITIEDSINLEEFFKTLKSFFPKDEWKEYKLEVKVIQNWNNPVYVPTIIDRWKPYWHTDQQWTCGELTATHTEGTYNLLLSDN